MIRAKVLPANNSEGAVGTARQRAGNRLPQIALVCYVLFLLGAVRRKGWQNDGGAE